MGNNIIEKLDLIGVSNNKSRVIANSGIDIGNFNISDIVKQDIKEITDSILDYYWDTEIEKHIAGDVIKKKVYIVLKGCGIELTKQRVNMIKSRSTLSEYKELIVQMLEEDIINRGTLGISELDYEAMRGLQIGNHINVITTDGDRVVLGKSKLQIEVDSLSRNYKVLSVSKNLGNTMELLKKSLGINGYLNHTWVISVCREYGIGVIYATNSYEGIDVNISIDGITIKETGLSAVSINKGKAKTELSNGCYINSYNVFDGILSIVIPDERTTVVYKLTKGEYIVEAEEIERNIR